MSKQSCVISESRLLQHPETLSINCCQSRRLLCLLRSSTHLGRGSVSSLIPRSSLQYLLPLTNGPTIQRAPHSTPSLRVMYTIPHYPTWIIASIWPLIWSKNYLQNCLFHVSVARHLVTLQQNLYHLRKLRFYLQSLLRIRFPYTLWCLWSDSSMFQWHRRGSQPMIHLLLDFHSLCSKVFRRRRSSTAHLSELDWKKLQKLR